jgi:predicted ATP-grasp superfamily ATP-dependent carboligase
MYKGQKEELRMYKNMRRRIVIVVANEKMIENRSSLFLKKIVATAHENKQKT